MTDIDRARIEYERWLSSEHIDSQLHRELISISGDNKAILDRFWRDLAFGTGGLRGIMGTGTNRMNEPVVRQATQGLADYVKANSGISVCIAYDTRHFSREFATFAAETLCANGIKVLMFRNARPTPMLSFAIREKKAFAGIVITASHNPSDYNGYKVYGADGGQITDSASEKISEHIKSHDVLAEHLKMHLDDAHENGLFFDLDDIEAQYYYKVKTLPIRKGVLQENAKNLRILYTPLHGTGNIPVRRVLGELGFIDLTVVKEQEHPDGCFPTVRSPNPEEPEAFELALKKTQEQVFDIILATDPDCDRIGVCVNDGTGCYALLSGNQVGALLCDYIIAAKIEDGSIGNRPAVIKTIVTTELVRNICDENGVALIDVLTGFKYIGEKISEWEHSGEYSFLFGFEESYGFLTGDFVRDKDAVIAAALICEMALYYKLSGLTLKDALNDLHTRYGYTNERLVSLTLEGQGGKERIAAIMEQLRTSSLSDISGKKIVAVEDYMDSLNGLPKSDVIKCYFADESWLAARPSGTEPKLKFYFGATGESRTHVEMSLNEIEAIVRTFS